MLYIQKHSEKIINYMENNPHNDDYDMQCIIKEALCGKGVCDNYSNEDCKGCKLKTFKWLLKEAKEFELSKYEIDILKRAKKQGYQYIVRNQLPYLQTLIIHKKKPVKHKELSCWASCDKATDISLFNDLFTFISYDDEEPMLIQDILDGCDINEDGNIDE